GMHKFEQAVYEYTRQWAQSLNRRDLLKGAGALGAAAGVAAISPSSLSAAPGSSRIALRRNQDGGSEIKIARGQVSDSLDPQKTSGLLVAHEIMWQIYDSLIYLHEDGTVYPGLATEWEIAEDGLTVTYKLRPDVNFHDGTPFNAQAVADTVARHLDPATASPTASYLGPLTEVQVVDDLTATYVYSEPFVPMFVGLGYSYCAPISIAAATESGDDFGRNPVGTGPYKFVEWTADDTIVLEKNPEHTWATPFYATQQAPSIDRVEFVVIPEDATRLAALIAGEVDVVAGTDAVPIDKLGSLTDEPGIEVYTRPAVGVYYAYFNQSIEPLNDVKVRQAIQHAVDLDAIVALVLDGHGTPATSALASAFGAYKDDLPQYPYDPDAAKALLEEAGYADGFDITYLNIASPVYQRVAEVLQEYLADVNINLMVESYPVGELIPKAATGEYGMTFFYYTYSDPDILHLILRTGQPFAWCNHNDDEFDGWLDEQRVTFDPDARLELLYNAQQRVNERAYILNLFEGVYAAAMQEKVEGLAIDLVGFIHVQEMSLAE
ncbi:MAG TPA: ABC transporter substrate-binding protein, partial [Thermomicrobiales bacterium]|nr:ABC transporter substrate-binding protein [Thermomicrobiales bacterium]